MLGMKLAQVALNFGSDDLDGTIVEERITHDAGATTAKGLTEDRPKRQLIMARRASGPVQARQCTTGDSLERA